MTLAELLDSEKGTATILGKAKELGGQIVTVETPFKRHIVSEIGSELTIMSVSSMSDRVRLEIENADVPNPFLALYRSSSAFPLEEREAICGYVDKDILDDMDISGYAKTIEVKYSFDLCEGNILYVELRSEDDPLKVFASDKIGVD